MKVGANPKEVGEREKRGASWALEAWRGSTGLPGVILSEFFLIT